MIQQIGQDNPLAKRWVSAELRLKSVTLLLVECYFVSGIGLTGDCGHGDDCGSPGAGPVDCPMHLR